jgi:3-dehydroquinate synthase
MMGAGKSTVGAALAQRLGWRYVDTDDEVSARRGQSVPEMWRALGEPAFRAEEAAVLRAAAASAEPVVVAVAGGALLDAANRAIVAEAGLVVWLRAEVATLVGRVGSGEGRPLLDGGAAEALARLYEGRRPLYQEVAHVTVDVDARSPGDVVDTIAEAVGAAGRSGAAADA